MLPEKTEKHSNYDVVSATLLIALSISNFLNNCLYFSCDFINQVTSSMTNFLILGTFMHGALYFSSISDSLFAKLVAQLHAPFSSLSCSSGLMNLKICVVSPINSWRSLLSFTMRECSTFRERKGQNFREETYSRCRSSYSPRA
ncbi:hypothetical protein DsansV1_C01g0008921 [Dioscorea sansibarensis]